jgi:hypothetical protein
VADNVQPYEPLASIFSFHNIMTMPGVVVAPGSGGHARYPARNLLNSDRTERCRLYATTAGYFAVTYDFIDAPMLNFDTIAIIDAKVVVAGVEQEVVDATVVGMNALDWVTDRIDITVRAVDKQRGSILVSHHQNRTAPSGGGLRQSMPSKRFWSLVFYLPNVNDYAEVGVLWLGPREEQVLEARWRTTNESRSSAVRLDSGEQVWQRNRRIRKMQFTSSRAVTHSGGGTIRKTSDTLDDMEKFRTRIEETEGRPILAAPYAFVPPIATAALDYKTAGAIYGYLADRSGFDLKTPLSGRYAFGIDEAVP